MSFHAIPHHTRSMKRASWLAVFLSMCLLAAILAWQAVAASGQFHPAVPQTSEFTSALDIAILVFREGLECILVLAAITAGMIGAQQVYQGPVAMGAGIGFVATLGTWLIAVHILDDISGKVSSLNLQAGTGLLAIVVLLIVMNWFFHKLYWTGWISLHNRRKHELLNNRTTEQGRQRRVLLGLGLLGFSSLYREGFEVVLFLQSYRLRLGNDVVLYGVSLGLLFTVAVGGLTFVAHRKLPYRRMLVFTGILLALVLFVMAGEQAQEMQLAHWLPTTQIPWLVNAIPAWTGRWLSIFPAMETMVGQVFALALVLGSYFLAQAAIIR